MEWIRAKLVHNGQLDSGTIAPELIPLGQALLGDDLEVGMIKPVAVFVKIAGPGESLTSPI